MNFLMIRDEDGHLDPVYVEEFSGLWYFSDETWATYYGPYTSEDDARLMFRKYCDTVLGSR